MKKQAMSIHPRYCRLKKKMQKKRRDHGDGGVRIRTFLFFSFSPPPSPHMLTEREGGEEKRGGYR